MFGVPKLANKVQFILFFFLRGEVGLKLLFRESNTFLPFLGSHWSHISFKFSSTNLRYELLYKLHTGNVMHTTVHTFQYHFLLSSYNFNWNSTNFSRQEYIWKINFITIFLPFTGICIKNRPRNQPRPKCRECVSIYRRWNHKNEGCGSARASSLWLPRRG